MGFITNNSSIAESFSLNWTITHQIPRQSIGEVSREFTTSFEFLLLGSQGTLVAALGAWSCKCP